MPWFVDFQQKYKDRGFVVLAVSLDAEGWKVVKPFAEKFQLNFPVVVGDNSLVEKYGGLSVLPTSFVIDKEGNIRSRHDGLRSKADWEAEIESLL
jgi:cytochrome c biogenesis protein CcmG/thiol:disulfide interchange protein DsbE